MIYHVVALTLCVITVSTIFGQGRAVLYSLSPIIIRSISIVFTSNCLEVLYLLLELRCGQENDVN